MNVYLYFVAGCAALVLFFAGMALGSFITERQHKNHKEK